MRHKGLVITSIAGVIGCAMLLGGCEWRPFGRDYFVSDGDGKAGATYGEPWVNSVTYGTVKNDTPHDAAAGDLYLAANYNDIISAEMTDGQDSVGVQEEALRQVSSCLLDIMKKPGNTQEERDINALYNLYTDIAGRENAWGKSILPLIKKLQDAQDINQLSDYLCSEDYFNNGESLVSFDYDLDYNDPSVYSFVIIPTALSLGDAGEYTDKSEYGEKREDVFKKQAAMLLEKAGYSTDGSQAIISSALDFEGKLAAHMNTQEFKYSSDYIDSVNNPVTQSHIKSTEGAFPLSDMLEAYGISESEHLYMIEPEWFKEMAALYSEENFDGIKSYLLIKALQGYADSADEATFTGMQDIYNEVYDVKTKETIEDHAYSYVKGLLPETLGGVFARTQISADAKADVEELTLRIKDKVKELVNGYEFLSDRTKAEAVQKLDNMKVNVAYSDSYPSMADVDIKTAGEGGSLAGALVSVREAKRADKLKRLNKKVAAGDFDGDVTDTEIRYFGHGNSLIVNAGAVKGLFKPEGSLEEKLAGLGSLIAREIAGAVLKSGADYDSEGKYNNYWTESDLSGYADEYTDIKTRLDAIKPFKNDTALDGARVLDSVVEEINGFKAIEAIANEEKLDFDKLTEALAKSRYTLMRERAMEETGLNSSDALPYIVVNMINQYIK